MDRYTRAFADHRYLWRQYGPAKDMTGGYVDQDDLEAMLANPTKAEAVKCLERQIGYWFDVGPDDGSSPRILAATDPRIGEIAERYGASL